MLTVLKFTNLKQNMQKNAASVSLDNVSKEFLIDKMKKTELCGYVYDFSVDSDNIDIVDI